MGKKSKLGKYKDMTFSTEEMDSFRDKLIEYQFKNDKPLVISIDCSESKNVYSAKELEDKVWIAKPI